MKHNNLIILIILLSISGSVYADKNETINDVMKADSNNDGKVSFEEYKAAHEVRMIERFKSKDINKDGFIDLEEKQVAKEKVETQRKVEKETEKQKLREKYQEERKRRKKHFFKNQ